MLKKAEELNVTLLLETEFSKGSKDPAASIKLLRKLFTEAQTPYLACNFDAANLYVAGEEPFPYAYEELKPWIHYVHIKDVRRLVPDIHSIENMKGYLQEGMIDGVCCAIGEGAVNYAGLLEALKADGYDGYLGLLIYTAFRAQPISHDSFRQNMRKYSLLKNCIKEDFIFFQRFIVNIIMWICVSLVPFSRAVSRPSP